jgi:hypothetical protein
VWRAASPQNYLLRKQALQSIQIWELAPFDLSGALSYEHFIASSSIMTDFSAL